MKTSIDTKNLAGATSELFVMMFGAPLAFFTSFAAGPEVRIEPARPRLELHVTTVTAAFALVLRSILLRSIVSRK